MSSYYEPFFKRIYINHRKTSYNFASHFHDKMELAYCFSGTQKILIGDRVYTMTKGDAVLVFPNVVHEYIKTDDEYTESYSLVCESDFLSSILPEITSKRVADPLVPADKIPKDAAMGLKRLVNCQSEGELLGWSLIVLASLFKAVKLEPAKRREEHSLAPTLISYINNNFKKNLNIKTLASEFGYSSSYIAHVFYEQLKIPFRTYLGSVRSEYAGELILKTDKSLTEISYDCGYNSLNTFCRCFKNHYGMTPSEFKKIRKKEVLGKQEFI